MVRNLTYTTELRGWNLYHGAAWLMGGLVSDHGAAWLGTGILQTADSYHTFLGLERATNYIRLEYWRWFK